MLAFGVDRDAALRRVDASIAGVHHFTDGFLAGGFRTLDQHLVHKHGNIGIITHIVDVNFVRIFGTPALLELVGCRRIQFLEPVCRRIHAVHDARGKQLVFEAKHDLDRACHRKVHARSVLLLVKRRLRGADIQHVQPIGLGALDVLDGLRELRHAERNELLAHEVHAERLHDRVSPGRGKMAKVVVGGDGVNALAKLFDHVGKQCGELLFRHGAVAQHIGVADAALILVGVDVESIETVDDRTNGFPRSRRNAADQHVDFVTLQQAASKLLVARIVALRVEMSELDRSSHDAARRVDLVHGELGAVQLGQADGGKVTRDVLEQADFDWGARRLRGARPSCRQACKRSGGGAEQ